MYETQPPQGTDSYAPMTTTATDAASNGVGPSRSRSNAGASAPGVAEGLGHRGAPEGKRRAAAADEAALRRIARRRKRRIVQRKERVDVRYSVEEKAEILAKARSLNIAGAHYVGAVVIAHVHGDFALPGQRTGLDDYIDELAALRQQVTTIGRLVNQVAKKLNSGGHPHPGDTAALAQAERTLHAVQEAVKSIAASADQTLTGRAAS